MGQTRKRVCVKAGGKGGKGCARPVQMSTWRRSTTLCAAAVSMVLLLASQAPVGTLRQAAPVALDANGDASVVDATVKRMHGDARLLLAHTIMAQGARRDLAKVAGGKASR